MTMKKNGELVGELIIVFESLTLDGVMVEGLGIHQGDAYVRVTSSGETFEVNSPEIRMLDGRTLLGFECWWAPAQIGRQVIYGREVGLLGARP